MKLQLMSDFFPLFLPFIRVQSLRWEAHMVPQVHMVGQVRMVLRDHQDPQALQWDLTTLDLTTKGLQDHSEFI